MESPTCQIQYGCLLVQVLAARTWGLVRSGLSVPSAKQLSWQTRKRTGGSGEYVLARHCNSVLGCLLALRLTAGWTRLLCLLCQLIVAGWARLLYLLCQLVVTGGTCLLCLPCQVDPRPLDSSRGRMQHVASVHCQMVCYVLVLLFIEVQQPAKGAARCAPACSFDQALEKANYASLALRDDRGAEGTVEEEEEEEDLYASLSK